MIKRKQLQRAFFLTAVICTAYLTGQAQAIDKSILTNYPAGIAARVYDIVSKTNIDATLQKRLADAFAEQDNIVVNLIKQKASSIAIDSIKQELQRRWYNILSAKQQYYYSTATDKGESKMKYSFSQFSFAIQNKDSIKLTEAQTDSLFLKIDTLKRMKEAFLNANPNKWFDSRAYESEGITRLLSGEQYTRLLTLKNRERAKNSALTDWNELVLRNLTAKYNKDLELQRLTEYYIEKQNAYDRYAHDKIKQSAMISYVSKNKPKILNALIHARRNPNNDTQGAAYQW